ncbi:MAG: TIGR03013 family PEP-CTERM/XrtA system glycosyltransferase [Betaproteobacteria bacterium]|nr:TIGR03013 family PEP-CTERM/XrtA system glycosyltransferase [Betaproteobacteria bacterium]
MVLLFNQRVPLVSVLELGLAVLVFSLSFVSAASGHIIDMAGGHLMLGAAVALFALSQVLCLGAFQLHRLDRGTSASTFAVRVALSLAVGAGVVYALFAAFPNGDEFRAALPEALLLSAAGLLLVRLLLVFGIEMDWLSHRILVLGTGSEALAVERTLQGMGRSGVTLLGFFPISSSTPPAVSSDRVIRSAGSLEEAIQRLRVNEVIVALQEQRGGALPVSQLLNCRLRGVRVTDLSGFFERMTGEVPVNSLKASWLIYGDGFRQGWTRRLVKRAFDLSASAVLLLLASPVMFLGAMAILLESGRPIIFRQERVGLGGRTFMLLKFRSMRTDAEKDGVPRWAATGDPRVTRVGRFIRRTRIDELPQIFNVLKGEMSFVGPRPERPFFVAQLTEQVPFYGARHTVKPGLTGWAQVRYSYGASVEDAVRKLQYDLYYVKNHTVMLDFVILVSTVRVVLMGEGAR